MLTYLKENINMIGISIITLNTDGLHFAFGFYILHLYPLQLKEKVC